MNNITKTVFNLIKNNGLFKSEKQAEFLKGYFKDNDGCIGFADSGYNSTALFVEFDNDGITCVYKFLKKKKGQVKTYVFQKSVPGTLSDMDLKEIKRLNRLINKEQKELDERIFLYAFGVYMSATNVENMEKHKLQIIKLQNKINEINGK